VHFGRASFRPGTVDGDRLLVHELVHVIQQRAGSSLDAAAAEVEADAVAAGSAHVQAGSGPPRERVQRQRVRGIRADDQEVQDIIDNRDPTTLSQRLAECQAGTGNSKTFPVRTTRFGSATLSADRDGDDIFVKIPGHVHSNSDFDAQTRTLPSEVFSRGLRLPRWEVVKVHLYESPWYAPNTTGSTGWDRQSEFCIPADRLLQISDEIRKATLLNFASSVEPLTAGVGGKAASAIGGAVVRGGRTALFATLMGIAEAAPTAGAGVAVRTGVTIAVPVVAGTIERQVAAQAVTQTVRAEATTQAA
jgi:Domain of unknown function (DUF4157)